MERRFRLIVAVVVSVLGALWIAPAAAGSSAVVFMYHRFGENAYPSTNIRLEQFAAHLAELKSGRYTVMGLPEIVTRLRHGKNLPDRTVAITIDDAYRTVYTEAWPRLKAAGFPFTVFVTTGPVDERFKGMMTWDQIRELKAGGVTIGHHTASHLHMPEAEATRNASEITDGAARLAAELGESSHLFAYPYGEYGLAVRKVIEPAGFVAAFGQHSGVIHAKSDFLYLPRFALNERYGEMARFRMAANALPLPVTDVTPLDPYLNGKPNPPRFAFTIGDEAAKGIKAVTCYVSGQGKAKLKRSGARRIEVPIERAFGPGRSRVNCTMPADNRRWRWFGLQFTVPKN